MEKTGFGPAHTWNEQKAATPGNRSTFLKDQLKFHKPDAKQVPELSWGIRWQSTWLYPASFWRAHRTPTDGCLFSLNRPTKYARSQNPVSGIHPESVQPASWTSSICCKFWPRSSMSSRGHSLSYQYQSQIPAEARITPAWSRFSVWPK